jgi:hypothetical protein
MIVEYHSLTVSDLNDAIAYYNRQRPGLGEHFALKFTPRLSGLLGIRNNSQSSSMAYAAASCTGILTPYGFASLTRTPYVCW